MKQLARALTITSALLLALTMLAAMPAHAESTFDPGTLEPVTVEQPTTVEVIREPGPTTDAEVGVGWTGYYIKFNRTETAKIALSAASCSVVVSKFAWGIAKPLSAACGLMTALAGYHLGRGYCLTAGVTFWGQPSFGSWNC